MKINTFVIFLLFATALRSCQDVSLTIIQDSAESNELEQNFPSTSLSDQTKTLRELTINNIANGTVTLSKLALLGFTSITSTNSYPLPLLCALEVGSTLLSVRQQYLTQKLENMNSIQENESCLDKLTMKNTFHLASGIVSSIASFGLLIMNPKENNILSNLILTLPTGIAGYNWSNHYENHQKYKKIKKSHETLL